MSVVKSRRGENELNVITKARELAIYTIKICSNEKNFPKKFRWCITNEIVKSAKVIHSNVRKANAVYTKDKSDYVLRKQFQDIALSEIDSLFGDMDIAYELFGVDSKKMEHWTGLVFDVLTPLRNWMKSDIKRFNK